MVSFLQSARCVLLIGDDALSVYDVSSRKTRLVDTVPFDLPDFPDSVAALIRKECPKPVLILNDMTDQHFKGGQRLPKVGVMDKKNLLKRKIEVAFPNYPIRGAMPIKESKSASIKEKRLSSGLYLYAAVPMSEPVSKTIEAVKSSLLPIAGFSLLPVEAADMVHALATKLAGKKQKSRRWVIFIGQHQNGSLRQVIVRDGQLAMTRMTPITDMDSDSAMWANEVGQELKATISYLSRFGFNPAEGVDIILIAGQEAGQAFEAKIDVPCQYTYLTAPEAARELGLKLGLDSDPRYAEALNVAWIGRKNRFSLPMKAPALEKVQAPRQAAALAVVVLLAAAGYLGWTTFNQAQKMMALNEDLTLQRGILVEAEHDYEREIARMKAVGFDAKLVQGAIKAYAEMEEKSFDTLEIIKNINEALGKDLRLDAFSLEQIKPKKKKNVYATPSQTADEGVKIKAVLKIKFAPTVEPALGVKEVNRLQQRLQQSFPGYEVWVEKNVAGLEYSDSFSGATGQAAEDMKKNEHVAELVIQGDI